MPGVTWPRTLSWPCRTHLLQAESACDEARGDPHVAECHRDVPVLLLLLRPVLLALGLSMARRALSTSMSKRVAQASPIQLPQRSWVRKGALDGPARRIQVWPEKGKLGSKTSAVPGVSQPCWHCRHYPQHTAWTPSRLPHGTSQLPRATLRAQLTQGEIPHGGEDYRALGRGGESRPHFQLCSTAPSGTSSPVSLVHSPWAPQDGDTSSKSLL